MSATAFNDIAHSLTLAQDDEGHQHHIASQIRSAWVAWLAQAFAWDDGPTITFHRKGPFPGGADT